MSKTVTKLRKDGHFVVWTKLPKTGNPGKDKSIIMRNLEQHVDDYLHGRKTPKHVDLNGRPESY